ncbi:helix-turn-helix domain-containing protein [Halpernia sp.]|uniref:helix-turn-helix domain-containing protein n=1 Tax=Halpernia sp. TaxID=2782209 RepID=UPI003A9446C6
MTILIKNMVCERCISAVQKIFDDYKIKLISISLGEVKTEFPISENQLQTIESQLLNFGFERIRNPTYQLIDKIKSLIIQKISDLDISENFLLSEFLSSKLNKDYSSLSKTFSQHENLRLEQFFILQKIEKVKELLSYNEFQLTEIAGKLGYKSVQHLSTQFRNSTGYSPTEFKNLKNPVRKPLDKVQ